MELNGADIADFGGMTCVRSPWDDWDDQNWPFWKTDVFAMVWLFTGWFPMF